MVIQAYAPTEEAEIEQFYEDLQPFRTNTQKACPFHYRGLECKSRKSRNTWGNRQIWPWNKLLQTTITNKGNVLKEKSNM